MHLNDFSPLSSRIQNAQRRTKMNNKNNKKTREERRGEFHFAFVRVRATHTVLSSEYSTLFSYENPYQSASYSSKAAQEQQRQRRTISSDAGKQKFVRCTERPLKCQEYTRTRTYTFPILFSSLRLGSALCSLRLAANPALFLELLLLLISPSRPRREQNAKFSKRKEHERQHLHRFGS